MRVLGLDVGEKTIGVAVGDPLGITAQGLQVIRRSASDKDLNSWLSWLSRTRWSRS